MSCFVVIPYIKVQAANFQSNGLIMGGAPLMAAAMFSHHLAGAKLIKKIWLYYVHHDIQPLGGEKLTVASLQHNDAARHSLVKQITHQEICAFTTAYCKLSFAVQFSN